MKVKVQIKNKDKYIEKIERAEAIIKELKNIFSWDLNGEIELEMETAAEKEAAAEDKINH